LSPGTLNLVEVNSAAGNVEKSEPRKHFFVGVRKFNENPEKGIKYLIENNIINEDEENIAKFLFENAKLSKDKVGDYISLGFDQSSIFFFFFSKPQQEKKKLFFFFFSSFFLLFFLHSKEFTNRVLEYFVQQIDCTGCTFDQALRKFLSESNFRLPGEAQKIDRMMTEFGRHYHSYEPRIFDSEDTAYILAFSTIMLNTDAHNPSVKRKMSLKDFLRNNSGIDNGKNLPEEFLTKVSTIFFCFFFFFFFLLLATENNVYLPLTHLPLCFRFISPLLRMRSR
jgi:Sec7-like guanine-nucleotide exchange factor